MSFGPQILNETQRVIPSAVTEPNSQVPSSSTPVTSVPQSKNQMADTETKPAENGATVNGHDESANGELSDPAPKSVN